MRSLILTLPMLLMGCFGTRTEYVEVKPEVPADLLRPVPLSDRKVKTYRDLAIRATEDRTSARQANAKITALGEILGE